jgi:putative protease
LTPDAAAKLDGEDRQPAREMMGAFRDWVWFQNGCGNSVTDRGIPNGPCGLCALYDLAATGVTSLKISGRSSSSLRKLSSLRMVRLVLDLVEGGASREEAAREAVAIRNTPHFCNAGYMCYYREKAS